MALFLQDKVFHAKSSFQEIDIVDTAAYGRMLLLDNQTQSAALDEFTYHESLVQPSMLSHPNPKRVFIGGSFPNVLTDKYCARVAPCVVYCIENMRRSTFISCFGALCLTGGGEGATAREVLRHKSVTEVVMADIDPVVCRVCKDEMVDWHQGAFDDERFKLVCILYCVCTSSILLQ